MILKKLLLLLVIWVNLSLAINENDDALWQRTPVQGGGLSTVDWIIWDACKFGLQMQESNVQEMRTFLYHWRRYRTLATTGASNTTIDERFQLQDLKPCLDEAEALDALALFVPAQSAPGADSFVYDSAPASPSSWSSPPRLSPADFNGALAHNSRKFLPDVCSARHVSAIIDYDTRFVVPNLAKNSNSVNAAVQEVLSKLKLNHKKASKCRMANAFFTRYVAHVSMLCRMNMGDNIRIMNNYMESDIQHLFDLIERMPRDQKYPMLDYNSIISSRYSQQVLNQVEQVQLYEFTDVANERQVAKCARQSPLFLLAARGGQPEVDEIKNLCTNQLYAGYELLVMSVVRLAYAGYASKDYKHNLVLSKNDNSIVRRWLQVAQVCHILLQVHGPKEDTSNYVWRSAHRQIDASIGGRNRLTVFTLSDRQVQEIISAPRKQLAKIL